MVDSIMLIGPSGSGKSSLAAAISKQSGALYRDCVVFDTDDIRSLWPELGFSKEHVQESVTRLGQLASLITKQLCDALVVVVVIAPFKESRQDAYRLLSSVSNNSALVYLDTDLDKRKDRDPKRLYEMADSGEIEGLAGYNSSYDDPDADIILHQEDKTPADLAHELLGQLFCNTSDFNWEE